MLGVILSYKNEIPKISRQFRIWSPSLSGRNILLFLKPEHCIPQSLKTNEVYEVNED